jgi:hypothetical protein
MMDHVDDGDKFDDMSDEELEADLADAQPLAVATSRVEYKLLIASGYSDPMDPLAGSQAVDSDSFRAIAGMVSPPDQAGDREREYVQA